MGLFVSLIKSFVLFALIQHNSKNTRHCRPGNPPGFIVIGSDTTQANVWKLQANDFILNRVWSSCLLKNKMLRSQYCIRLLAFLIVQVIFLYSIIVFLLQNTCEQRREVQGFGTVQEYLHMKSKLIELQSTINRLETRNRRKSLNLTEELDRPSTHKLANDVDVFGELVTVILYRDRETTQTCLQTKEKNLRQNFPKLKILTSNNTNEPTVGFQFNSLISDVLTPYFFFLNSRHDLLDHNSDNSPGWLLHALENVPELDFVSGSILNEDRLEIPCYRMKLCNWTLSQRYEYRRSIGELMICENIASSFMGRTKTIKRLSGSLFDENLISLSTTDFFLTAKQAGAVCGVRPEVFFHVSNHEKCKGTKTTNRRQQYLSLLPFAHKHKVFRFRHPDSNELDLCDLHSSPILGEDICDEAVARKIMLNGGHWAYQGTFAYPFIIKNLQYCMFEVVDLFSSKNVSFAVTAGASLGTVKMRGVLPWDAGDIDIGVNNYNQDELYKIISDFARKRDFTVGLINNEGVYLLCAGSALAPKIGGIVTMFMTDFKKPKYVKMKINGRWVPHRRQVFSDLRNDYGVNYFQHKLYRSQEILHCKKTGHNACLPDFRTNDGQSATTGTFKEHFCDL